MDLIKHICKYEIIHKNAKTVLILVALKFFIVSYLFTSIYYVLFYYFLCGYDTLT